MTASDHDTNTLAAIVPLRNAGFALHWLKAREKRPDAYQWSTAPVASLDELRKTHFRGANLGVRLGEPSDVGGAYLHALDFDIRIPDLVDEAWAAFAKLFPGVDVTEFPSVISGSGGDSRHVYFVTDKPFSGKKLAVSEGKHRGADGKWHCDWEIDLFGTGKQTALPPSIHPNTGLPYVWEREVDFDGFEPIPSIPAATIEAFGVVEAVEYGFESRPPLEFKPGQMERELDLVPVSDLDYDDWIRLGQALHHQFGGSQEGFDVWLTHTKRSSKYVGEKQDREMRRIKWRSFGRYRGGKLATMATVRQWAMDAMAAGLADEFDDLDDDLDTPVEGAAEADDFDALLSGNAGVSGAAQAASDDWDGGELTEEEKTLPWTSLLGMDSKGENVAANLHNIELIVKNDPRLIGLPQMNLFTQETVQRTPPGVKRKKRKNAAKETRQLTGPVWEVRDTLNGENWSSSRDYSIRSIIEAPKTQGGYGIKVSDRDLKAATVLAAWQNGFHPVREYLNGITWDGKPRIEQLFIDYLGCEDSPYTREVGRLMMIAGVTRVFEPGCKWDYAVILEGLQGAGKSTFIRVLGKQWFSELEGNFHDGKEMVEKMQGSWIVEIPELSGFNKADVPAIKAFISRQTDKVRLAYEARAMDFPRQCILIGSTNDKEYLRDATGGRRFFPMECHVERIDNALLRQNVDQLWAEAVSIYRAMRQETPVEMGDLPLYMMDADAAEEAARLQESRRVESVDDATAGQIAEWLGAPLQSGSIDDDFENGQRRYRTETCLIEIWCECFGNERKAYGQINAQLLGRAMRLVPGWELSSGKTRFDRYGQQRFYVKGNEADRNSRMGILKFN